jgi:hypothetical protein
MFKVCILCEITSFLSIIHVRQKSGSWNTSISRALHKQVLFWWQQQYQHVWTPRYKPKQDRHSEKSRFLLWCRATRTTVCQPVLIITAVLHNVSIRWMNRFGLTNGTRLLKLINYIPWWWPATRYATRLKPTTNAVTFTGNLTAHVAQSRSIHGLVSCTCVPLFRRTPRGWHSGAETCRSWYLSWTVFYYFYFNECTCWLIYWMYEP